METIELMDGLVRQNSVPSTKNDNTQTTSNDQVYSAMSTAKKKEEKECPFSAQTNGSKPNRAQSFVCERICVAKNVC